MIIRFEKYEVEDFLRDVIPKELVEGKEIVRIDLKYDGAMEISFVDKGEGGEDET